MKIVIGITDTEAHYGNYPNWIKATDPEVEIIKLKSERPDDIGRCHGVVLSGGVDTHPRFYGSNNLLYPNAPTVFDETRDQFELDIFRLACQELIPILAICRGMQLVNISLGGNMIQDIEAIGKNNHRKTGDSDTLHDLEIARGTLLYEITGEVKAIVNSAHHQAIDTIAPELLVNAWSSDGIVEGLEWRSKEGKTFLLGVQGHPERLGNLQIENPFGNQIREAFLDAVKSGMGKEK